MGDHDALFKRVFAVPANAAEMLRCILPSKVVDAIDLSRLELLSGESISDHLDELRGDLLFRAPLFERDEDGEEEYVYLPLHMLVEHQSTPPQHMPLRAMRYVLPVWLRVFDEHPGLKRLPPVAMLVVYHGPSRWTGPRSLHDMVGGLDRLPELREYVPNLVLLIDDLAKLGNAALLARRLSPVPMTAMWLLRDGRDADALLENLPVVAEVLSRVVAESPDETLFFLRYISSIASKRPAGTFQTLWRAILDHIPAAEAPLATIADELKEEGRMKGRQEGQQETLRHVLRLLLEQRFGALSPEHEALIAAAPQDVLQRAVERVQLASDLSSVFQPH